MSRIFTGNHIYMFMCSNFENKNGYKMNFQVGKTAFWRITMIIE